MSPKYAVAEAPIADAGPDSNRRPVFFDALPTIISQYANSPILLAIIQSVNEAVDPLTRSNDFYRLIWNVDSAQGYGLDVWGRIVGVSRTLHVPIPGDYLGFDEAGDADTFDHGVWYNASTLTQNFALSDTAYRRLILAKAALNITNGSSSSINAILMSLFPDHGNCYVRDDGGMELTYVFETALTPVEYSIVTQSGVLPKPVGVAASVEAP